MLHVRWTRRYEQLKSDKIRGAKVHALMDTVIANVLVKARKAFEAAEKARNRAIARQRMLMLKQAAKFAGKMQTAGEEAATKRSEASKAKDEAAQARSEAEAARAVEQAAKGVGVAAAHALRAAEAAAEATEVATVPEAEEAAARARAAAARADQVATAAAAVGKKTVAEAQRAVDLAVAANAAKKVSADEAKATNSKRLRAAMTKAAAEAAAEASQAVQQVAEAAAALAAEVDALAAAAAEHVAAAIEAACEAHAFTCIATVAARVLAGSRFGERANNGAQEAEAETSQACETYKAAVDALAEAQFRAVDAAGAAPAVAALQVASDSLAAARTATATAKAAVEAAAAAALRDDLHGAELGAILAEAQVEVARTARTGVEEAIKVGREVVTKLIVEEAKRVTAARAAVEEAAAASAAASRLADEARAVADEASAMGEVWTIAAPAVADTTAAAEHAIASEREAQRCAAEANSAAEMAATLMAEAAPVSFDSPINLARAVIRAAISPYVLSSDDGASAAWFGAIEPSREARARGVAGAIELSRVIAEGAARRATLAQAEAAAASADVRRHAREVEILSGAQSFVRAIELKVHADKVAEEKQRRRAEARKRTKKAAQTTMFNAEMQKVADEAQAARNREDQIVDFADETAERYMAAAEAAKVAEDAATAAAAAAMVAATRQAMAAAKAAEEAVAAAVAATKAAKIAEEKGATEVAQGAAAVHEALKTALLAKGPEAWDIVTSKARVQRKLEATAKMIIGGKRKEADKAAAEAMNGVKASIKVAKAKRSTVLQAAEEAEAAWQMMSVALAIVLDEAAAADRGSKKAIAAAEVCNAAKESAARFAEVAAEQAASEAQAARLAATGQPAAKAQVAAAAAASAADEAEKATAATATAPAAATGCASAAKDAAEAVAAAAHEAHETLKSLATTVGQAEAASIEKQSREAEAELVAAQMSDFERAEAAKVRVAEAAAKKEEAQLKAKQAAERASAAGAAAASKDAEAEAKAREASVLGDQADTLSAKAKAEKLAAKEAAEAASAEMSAIDRLREALRANLERVTDLFRTLDENLNGMISKKEFRRVIPQLGLQLSAATVDELFDTFDVDGSGHLEYHELKKKLRKIAAAESAAAKAAAQEEAARGGKGGRTGTGRGGAKGARGGKKLPVFAPPVEDNSTAERAAFNEAIISLGMRISTPSGSGRRPGTSELGVRVMLSFDLHESRAELLARSSSMVGARVPAGGDDGALRLTSCLSGGSPTTSATYPYRAGRGAAAVAASRAGGPSVNFFAPVGAAYPEDVVGGDGSLRSPRALGSSVSLQSLGRAAPSPMRFMSATTRAATRELLERARTSMVAEDERASLMREILAGPARQERLVRLSHMDSEDRAVRRDEKQTAMEQDRHRAKQAWDAEMGMQLARGAMVSSIRAAAVRPVLSGRAAAAAAAVVGWPDELASGSEIASGSELPPGAAHSTGAQSWTLASSSQCSPAPYRAPHWPPHGAEPSASKSTEMHTEMLPIYKKTLRGAGKLQSPAYLPHLSSRTRAMAMAADPAILHSPYTNAYPHGGPSPLHRAEASHPRPRAFLPVAETDEAALVAAAEAENALGTALGTWPSNGRLEKLSEGAYLLPILPAVLPSVRGPQAVPMTLPKPRRALPALSPPSAANEDMPPLPLPRSKAMRESVATTAMHPASRQPPASRTGMSRSASVPAVLMKKAQKLLSTPGNASDGAAMTLLEAIAADEGWL